MAKKVEGAIVLEERGNDVKYQWVCSHCGHKELPIRGLKGNGFLLTTFSCTKCRKRTNVNIHW